MKTLLKTEGLSKTYGNLSNSLDILKNINLIIMENEITVLMGPSGSGKSTLLNILGTLDTDYSGNIFINDVHVNKNDDLAYFRSRKLGFIFQFHHLLPEFTILENLQIPSLIVGKEIEKSKIIEMLTYVGLNRCKNHYPYEISGGERQRAAVLRALINKPALVLADEPTGNLDRENSQLLLNLVSDLKEKYQQSFFIATHDDSVVKIADRILYLQDGKIKEG